MESAQRRGRRSLHFNRSGPRRWRLGNELLRSVAQAGDVNCVRDVQVDLCFLNAYVGFHS
jgi:hypothetical protein